MKVMQHGKPSFVDVRSNPHQCAPPRTTAHIDSFKRCAASAPQVVPCSAPLLRLTTSKHRDVRAHGAPQAQVGHVSVKDHLLALMGRSTQSGTPFAPTQALRQQQRDDIDQMIDTIVAQGGPAEASPATQKLTASMFDVEREYWLGFTDSRESPSIKMGKLSFNMFAPRLNTETLEVRHIIGGPDKRFDIFIDLMIEGRCHAQMINRATCERDSDARLKVSYYQSSLQPCDTDADRAAWHELLGDEGKAGAIIKDYGPFSGHLDILFLDDALRIERGSAKPVYVLVPWDKRPVSLSA